MRSPIKISLRVRRREHGGGSKDPRRRERLNKRGGREAVARGMPRSREGVVGRRQLLEECRPHRSN